MHVTVASRCTSRVWHMHQTLSLRAGDAIHPVLWS